MALLSVQQFMQEKHQSGSRVDEQKWSGKQTFVKLQKKKKRKKSYTCISYHSNPSTKSFLWLHIPGMLQWVENKEESNQGAINTRAFTCWWVFVGQWSLYGFISCCYKIQTSCCSRVHMVTTVGQRQREADEEEEWLKKKLQHSSAVAQTSALICGSTPRWS